MQLEASLEPAEGDPLEVARRPLLDCYWLHCSQGDRHALGPLALVRGLVHCRGEGKRGFRKGRAPELFVSAVKGYRSTGRGHKYLEERTLAGWSSKDSI
jgi:hypothetical protein